VVLSYENYRDELRVEIGWRGLHLSIYLYYCKNETGNLNSELQLRKASPAKPITLIPVTLVETPLQLVQGALHYKFYAGRVSRIKNQGLLLALLITGMKQLDELIELFSSELEKGVDYYLVGVDALPGDLEGCKEVDVTGAESRSLRALVKNTRLALSLT